MQLDRTELDTLAARHEFLPATLEKVLRLGAPGEPPVARFSNA